MSNPYRELYNAPGAKNFSLAGLVARMPISMNGIGIITMLSLLHGSYGLAGAVAATFVLSSAIFAPQISRMADRYGQRHVLPIATAINIIAMLALLLCTRLEAPNWTLFLFAALAGCLPSMSAMSRARWTHIYRGKSQLQTAYALESVMDEMCFIIGPPLSVGLSVAVFPEAGPLAALVLLAIGVTVFVLQRRTEPPVQMQTLTNTRPVIYTKSILILALLLMAMGITVGTIDVVSVAFAAQQNQPAAASIVLSAYAISSCLAGLAFGAIKFNLPLSRLFLLGGLATAITTVPLLFVSNILGLSMAVFVAGLFFAPTLIISMALVESIVPSAKLTEGLTWLITGLGMGVAMGATASGWMVDVYGARAGFWVAIIAGCVVLGITLYGYLLLQKDHLSSSPSDNSTTV